MPNHREVWNYQWRAVRPNGSVVTGVGQLTAPGIGLLPSEFLARLNEWNRSSGNSGAGVTHWTYWTEDAI